MKKILSLLTALTLTASSTTSVISCSSGNKENKHVNSNGNSVWAWLPGLDQGKSPDTADVWNEADPFAKNKSGDFDTNPNDWTSSTKQTVYSELMQIMNVSILSKLGSSKDQSKYYSPNKDTYEGFSNYFKDDFKDAWANLKANVQDTINDKIQSFKDNDGKNWKKKYDEFLKNNYDSSEEKYRASLYISGTDDNATMELEKIFLKNNERNNKTVSANYIVGLKSEYTNASNPDEWVKDNLVKARELLLGYTPYNTNKNSVWDKDNKGTLNKNDIIQGLKSKSKSFTTAYKVSEKLYDTKNDKFTVNYSSLNDSDNSKAIMSPTQNYINSKYFSTAKPLAISEITFKFDNSYKLSNDVQNHIPSTTGESGGTYAFNQDTMKHILDLLGNKNGYNWDKLKTNNDIDASEKPTYDKDLLTITSDNKSFDTESKAAIYGSLTDLMNSTDIPNSHASLDKYDSGSTTPLTKFKTFIAGLNRSNGVGDISTAKRSKYNSSISNSMYKIYNIGKDNNKDINNNVIIMLKDDGLHIMHVDGLNFIKTYSESAPTSYFSNVSQSYQTDNNNFNFNINKTIDQDPQSWSATTSSQTINDQGKTSNIFNKNIWNHYLQYLTNYSWLNQQKSISPLEQFNFLTSAQAFASAPSSSTLPTGKWYTWIYDLFSIYYKDINNNTKMPSGWKSTWWQNFINIGGDDSTSEQYKNWFGYMDNEAKSQVNEQTLIRNFTTSIIKENDTIKGKDPTKYPVKGTFNQDNSIWSKYFAQFMNPTTISADSPYSLWYTYKGEN